MKDENKVLNERLKVLQDENAKLLNDCCCFKYDQDTDIQQKPAKSTFSKVIQTQRLDNDNTKASEKENIQPQFIDLSPKSVNRNPVPSVSTPKCHEVDHDDSQVTNNQLISSTPPVQGNYPPRGNDRPPFASNNGRLDSVTPKYLVPCPFLRRKGFCLKDWRCDFLHNDIVQRPVPLYPPQNLRPFSHIQGTNPFQTVTMEPNFPNVMNPVYHPYFYMGPHPFPPPIPPLPHPFPPPVPPPPHPFPPPLLPPPRLTEIPPTRPPRR